MHFNLNVCHLLLLFQTQPHLLLRLLDYTGIHVYIFKYHYILLRQYFCILFAISRFQGTMKTILVSSYYTKRIKVVGNWKIGIMMPFMKRKKGTNTHTFNYFIRFYKILCEDIAIRQCIE